MSNIHYILFDLEAGKLAEVTAKDDCRYLDLLSCFSRIQQRPFELKQRVRENKAISIGILYTVIPIGIDIVMNVYRITGQYSLITLEVVTDGDAGTPSAAVPSTAPNPPSHHASGIYRDSVTRHYRMSPQSLYMSKTGPGKPRPSCPAGG